MILKIVNYCFQKESIFAYLWAMMYSTCLAQIEAKLIDLSLKALLIILKPNFLSNSRLKFICNVSSTPLRQAEQQKMLKPVHKK